jgi:RsiW-degrading membrane proteinase PrsW (M82 family)
MSEPSATSAAPEQLPTVTCPTCDDTVPVGAYCGACGHHLAVHRDDETSGFRGHAYAAAPGEHVLRVSIVSSLFPHLPHRSRAAFRVAVVVLVVALVVLAALRLQAPMIAVAALGVPLLFQLYLQESDVYEDLPVSLLALGVLLGAALGVGWALLTDDWVSRSISTALIGGGDATHFWLDAVLIPVGGGLLLLVPAFVVFAIRPPHLDESMDGFLIGSIGAVGFTAAATITHLAPQLKTGIVAHNRPVESLVVEALLQGVAVPITAASVGGVVGASLWVRRRSQVHLGRWLASARLMVPAALLIYLVLGVIDYWQPSQWLLLGLHAVIALIAVLVLRYGLHAILLHEEHAVQIGAPRVCPHCEHVVPTMPFCPHCGYAGRAASRSSRSRLHLGAATEQARSAEGGAGDPNADASGADDPGMGEDR